MQHLKGFGRIGLAVLAVASLFAIVGCSNSQMTGPDNSSMDQNSSKIVADEGARSNYTFEHSGVVAKFDSEARIIQFAGGTLANPPVTVEIAPGAQMTVGDGHGTVPFDFKTVAVGSFATVYGETRANDLALVDLIQLSSNVASSSMGTGAEAF